MSKDQFTPEAAILWSIVSQDARERILKNVFCVDCCSAAELVNFAGEAKNGDLVLEGACAKCGGKVVRILESSELNPTRN